MAITGVHVPHGDAPLTAVTVDQTNAVSYYPYVAGGPVEAAPLHFAGHDVVVYVNARYLSLDETTLNPRATAILEMAGVGMAGGRVRGDALMVLAPGRGSYERSLPADLVAALLATDAG